MRICQLCGFRSSARVCPRDNIATSVFQKNTDFPGRLAQGCELLGRFAVEELVGVGGMGAVYRGSRLQNHSAVAIKVLWHDLAREPSEIKRFTREARAAGMLSHPHIVKVVDFGSDTQSHALFIVMEYLTGQKLSDAIVAKSVLPPLRTVYIGAQTCKALAETHRKGIVHRDIKPDNIFLQNVGGKRDFVKLVDFGLSIFTSTAEGEARITRPGFVVGSPEYIAPEQAVGDTVGPAADLYSLGVVLYECLSGRPPFTGATHQELLRQHILEPPPPLVGPTGGEPIPPALAQVVMQCLEKDPSKRPADADALEVALQRACDPTPARISDRISQPKPSLDCGPECAECAARAQRAQADANRAEANRAESNRAESNRADTERALATSTPASASFTDGLAPSGHETAAEVAPAAYTAMEAPAPRFIHRCRKFAAAVALALADVALWWRRR